MFVKVKFVPIILMVGIFLFIIPAFSQNANINYIEQLEEQLFSTKYTDQPTADRLSRLEETIFGTASNDDTESVRIKRLQALLSPSSSSENTETFTDTQKSSSKDDTITSSQQNYNDVTHESYNNYKQNKQYEASDKTDYVPMGDEDKEVEDYPAVSYLEQQIFNKTYKGEDVAKRLDRLEQNIFNEARPNQSLSERLDNLKLAVLGTTNIQLAPRMPNNRFGPPNNNSQLSYGSTYQQDLSSGQQQYFQSPEMNTFQNGQNYPSVNEVDYIPIEPGYESGSISQESLREVTSKLEEQLLNQTFENDPLNVRLDRLEMQIFQRTAPGYTPESRIERIVAVTAAEATSDPHDLKRIKRLRKIQTGLTVGGILFSILRGFLF